MQFFVGKGGVGKSTLAAATAQRAAHLQARVLLVSIDQAHSLADVLQVPVSGGDREPVENRWEAIELDTLSLVAGWLEKFAHVAAAGPDHDHGVQFGVLEPEEVIGLPGAQEVLALHRIAQYARSGEYDLIVVDCPAGADSMRILAAPAMIADYLERVWPRHSRMLALSGTDSRAVLLVSAVEQLAAALAEIRALLGDRTRTSLRVVTTARAVVHIHTRRLLAVAALSALRVDAIIVNHAGAPGSTRGQENQSEVSSQLTAELGSAAPGAAVLCAPHLDSEPVGLPDLSRIASLLYPAGSDAVTALGEDVPPVEVVRESGSGTESVYALRVHLPLVDPATLTLGRVEDDLIAGAEGARRRIRLAAVLQRCVVSGAELDGTALIVRFTPDPQAWPQ